MSNDESGQIRRNPPGRKSFCLLTASLGSLLKGKNSFRARLARLGIGAGLGICTCLLSAAWAQTGTGGGPQIPYGQTFKDFQFPNYQNGQLNSMLSAASAKGITLNRAETTDLKIQFYSNGKVITTVTSPKADLYLSERIMRTKNTVLIERADMEATAQTCDFNLQTKKYLLRDNVKVILKNFDSGLHTPKPKSPDNSRASNTPSSTPAPLLDIPSNLSLTPGASPRNNNSLLDSPGAYANTNVAPTPSSSQ